MDIAHPLRSLIPSLDSTALEVLARMEGDVSLADLHRIARRGSRSGLETVISRLVIDGLVLARPAGRGAMYSLNRDHVLAPAVLAANAARMELIDRVRAELQEWNPLPLHASIFGSFARREGGPLSDIDVVIVVPESASADDIEEHVDRLRSAVLRWTGNRLETLVVTPSQISQATGERVFGDIAEQGIHLVGVPWRTLLRSEQ